MSRPAGGANALTTARLRVLALCFVLAFVSIGIRLVDMVGGNRAEAAFVPPGGDDAPDPRRADITDRNGALLATNIATLSVVGDP
ncbi:MAG: penicillin-binding protein 2, partial [Geminicoccaceae bacterium]